MKKALIIGAGGFVGPYLYNFLLNKGIDVLATKLESETNKQNIKCVNLDILNQNQITDILKSFQPDVIYHLAAQSSVKLSWEKPQLTYQINVIGCINLLEATKTVCPNSKIILIGSSEEYGSFDKLPIKEDAPIKSTNFYASSKASQHDIGMIYHKAYGMNVIAVRAFNHIGVGQNTMFVVPSFAMQIANLEKCGGGKINVGNLTSKRDFSDVRDIVNAYYLLGEKGKSGETYNVGSGKSISIKTILDKLISYAKYPIDIEIDQNKFRPIDTPDIYADITKLVKDTGFKPEYDIDDTLKEILESFR